MAQTSSQTELGYEMPASAAQQYIVQHSGERPSAWNIAVRFRLSGPLQADLLEAAIHRVVDQHEVLRTCFLTAGSQIHQHIVESCVIPLSIYDLSSNPSAGTQEVERISRDESARFFDLHSPPLLRVGLIKVAPEDHILLLTAHHAICDGWSVGLLASDIMRAYADIVAGAPRERDEAALQYADYAVAQLDFAKTPEYLAHAAFWKKEAQRLESASPPPQPHAAQSTYDAEIHSRVLPLALTQSIEALARNEDLTFFEVVLSVFALVRMRATGLSHTEFATPVSGRATAETESIVGSFVNYLPIGVSVTPQITLSGFRHAVADAIREILAHADYRTEELLANASPSLASVFDHVFICQRDFVPIVEGAGVRLTPIPSVSPGALHAMTFFLVQRADGWRMSCEIDRSAYTADDAEFTLNDFEEGLRFIAENPNALAASVLSPAPQTDDAHQPKATPVDLPASASQQRYWMLQQVQPDKGALHLRIRLRLQGHFDPEIARLALQSLVDRHETLRTALFQDGDSIRQRIYPIGASPSFETKDLRQYKPQSLADLLLAEDNYIFDADQHSWLRVLAILTSEAETLLAITLPHTIADGWSCAILLREFYSAYDELSHGQQPRFEAQLLQYANVVLDEQQSRESSATQARREWWRSHLPAKLLPLALPADHPRSPSTQAGITIFSLDPMLAASVRQFAQDNGVTPFTVYGAALFALLARYTRQAGITLITPFANRTAETERIIGPFAIPVPLFVTVPSTASFSSLLTTFQQQAMAAFENALPLEQCVELTSLQSRFGRHPANQISFFYQTAFVSQATTTDFTATPLPATASGAAFEWQFAVIDYGTDLRIEFQYDSGLWSKESIRLCLEHYQRLLSELTFHPDQPLTSSDISTEEERSLLHHPESLLPISRRALNLAIASAPAPVARSSSPYAAPRNSFEQALASVWQQVFASDTVGIHDNFFDLGGHSLILARIQSQLKQATGHRIVAADIFAAPTIAELAERLQGAQEHPPQTQIFPLYPSGSQPPLFLISQSLVFHRMVESLHPDQPVYTVLLHDDDLRAMPRASFEEIASHYVSLIRAAHPTGPYRLGGWCVSSWLAYEVAQQLRDAGQQVDLLLLVDGWAPGYWRRLGYIKRHAAKANYYLARASRHLRMLAASSVPERLDFLRSKARLIRTATARQLASLFYSAGITLDLRVEEQLTLADQVVYAASRRYHPRRGDFPALLFRSAEQPHGRFLPSDLGWSDLLERPIDAIPLPGDHREIFDDPGAQILAQAIGQFLHLPSLSPAQQPGSITSPGSPAPGSKQNPSASCALAHT